MEKNQYINFTENVKYHKNINKSKIKLLITELSLIKKNLNKLKYTMTLFENEHLSTV